MECDCLIGFLIDIIVDWFARKEEMRVQDEPDRWYLMRLSKVIR